MKSDSSSQIIGIDLGGSAIKLGTFDQNGTCHKHFSIPTPEPSTPEAVCQAISTAVTQLDPEKQCLAIGVGTPGPVDGSGRIAKVAINLAGWHNVPLAEWLEKSTHRPVIMANDANCAGLGEAWLGSGRHFQNLILLTLGTGVGGAIILNNQLYTGPNGCAGELGLITIDLYGPECHSGNRGSLEQHVSVQAIRRRTGTEPADLAHAAAAGNRDALEFWQTYGHQLGAGLASLIYVLTPEAIILGGGVAGAAEFFLPATIAEIEQRVIPECRLNLQILTAELGNSAGMVGAAKLAWQLLES